MRIDILGVGFDNLTMTEAVARGCELLAGEGAHYVVTPNPEIVETCRADAEAMAAVNGADLVLPDGIGVIYGAKLLGTPLTSPVPGSADMALVCLGAPKQEKWMAQYGAATGAKLLLGLGGSLDVFAGVAQRAPEFYCKHNLEWLYRLIKNPSRAGRMMKLPLFLVHVAGEKRK